MLYRMKSGCDKSSYTGTKNYYHYFVDILTFHMLSEQQGISCCQLQ